MAGSLSPLCARHLAPLIAIDAAERSESALARAVNLTGFDSCGGYIVFNRSAVWGVSNAASG